MDMNAKSNYKDRRNGESETAIARSDRFFQQEAYWYFRTREGLDIGPFDKKEDAETGFNGFLGFLQQAHEDVVTKITTYIKLQARKNEKINVPARTDRLFEQENYWYFRTREGMDIGPFDTRGEASVGAKSFVGFLEGSQPEIVSRVTDYIKVA
jgi:chromatin remodeling complex protein RSC6